VSALVLLHPAMTGRDAHEWCERHAADLEVSHRQGRVHLIVVAQPRVPAREPPVFPLTFACGSCGWAGADPHWLDTADHFSPPIGEIPCCPRCEAPYPTLARTSP